MTTAPPTAIKASLISCQSCHLLIKIPSAEATADWRCPRCGAKLYHRKPHSVAKTWLLLIIAIFLYIPANVLPVTLFTSFGYTQADTIMSGVIYLMKNGMWVIASIIFIASILIPLLKIIILSFLLISVQIGLRWRPKDRSRLYRIIESIGRWSMVDVYVVTIMVAMVKLGFIGNFQAGPGIIAFAAVVIFTMLATMCFDSRLIWDATEMDDDGFK
jgi:paraquat-inducible protein A